MIQKALNFVVLQNYLKDYEECFQASIWETLLSLEEYNF